MWTDRSFIKNAKLEGQLFMILKASIRLIIQVNALPKFIEQVTQEVKPTSIPEDQRERIRSTMIPNAGSPYLKKEKPNSPSCLLAATLAFKTLNTFGSGVTQIEDSRKLMKCGQSSWHCVLQAANIWAALTGNGNPPGQRKDPQPQKDQPSKIHHLAADIQVSQVSGG